MAYSKWQRALRPLPQQPPLDNHNTPPWCSAWAAKGAQPRALDDPTEERQTRIVAKHTKMERLQEAGRKGGRWCACCGGGGAWKVEIEGEEWDDATGPPPSFAETHYANLRARRAQEEEEELDLQSQCADVRRQFHKRRTVAVYSGRNPRWMYDETVYLDLARPGFRTSGGTPGLGSSVSPASPAPPPGHPPAPRGRGGSDSATSLRNQLQPMASFRSGGGGVGPGPSGLNAAAASTTSSVGPPTASPASGVSVGAGGAFFPPGYGPPSPQSPQTGGIMGSPPATVSPTPPTGDPNAPPRGGGARRWLSMQKQDVESEASDDDEEEE